MRQTMKILRWGLWAALLLNTTNLNAQLFYNNGASIYASEGSLIFVDGIVQNQSGTIDVDENAGTNGEFIIQDNFINNSTAGGNGYYRVLGDWINNNTFNAGTGTVFLEGGNQLLDGSVSTSFYNLTLDGSGLKTQTIDQFCTGILDLKDLELQNEIYGFYVQNTDVNAIIRTTGFVSALDGGFLSRQTNSTLNYLFPVGSSVGTLRYRPVKLTPQSANANTYTVRMANVLATTEGYDVNALPPKICEVNPDFYHQINRTIGSDAADINISYNETEDGSWDGLSNWTTAPDLWDIILSTVITPGSPFNEAFVPSWNTFVELPYILYREQADATITAPGDFCVTDAAINLNAADAGGTWTGTGITDAANGTFDPSTAGSGTHTITYDVGTGTCGNTDQITINVNPIPDATITDPGNFCANDAALNLSAATSGGTWSGNGITDAINGTFDPTVAGTGTHTITYDVNLSGCSNTDNISIIVNSLPNTPTVSTDCSGGSDAGIIDVTSPIGANYEYSIDGTYQLNTSFGPLLNGNYTVTVMDISTGCTASSSVIALNCGCANPTSLNLSSTADNTCIESTYSLNGNTFGGSATEVNLAHDGNGSLSATNFTSSPFSFTYTPDPADAGNLITITVTTDNPLGAPCTISQETFSLTVRNIPSISLNSNSPVCEGSDLELTENGGAANNWNWTGPNAFSSTLQNPTISGATSLDAGNYSLTISDIYGCTASDNLNVTINPSPSANAGGDFDICEGNNINLTETGGDANSWSWIGPDGFTSSNQNPTISAAGNTNAGTYTVEISDLNGCTASDNVIVGIYSAPSVNAGSDFDICEGNDINLTETGGDANSWNWTGPDGFTSSNQNPTITATGSTNAGTYTVEISDINGCTSTDDVIIGINPTPTANAGADIDVCEGENINLTETGGDAISWSWTGPNTFGSLTQNPTINNASASENGIYSVEITDAYGCTATDDVLVSVNPAPDATITDPGDFCSTDAAMNLSAATSGGTWTGSGITDAVNGTFDPTSANIGNNSITYEVSVGGCTSSDNINIEIFDSPNATITDPGTLCSNDAAINLTAVTTGGTWSGTGITDAANGTFDPSTVTPGIYTITYNVGTGSCTDSDQIDITVNPNPDATITDPGDFCSTDAAMNLSAATSGGTWTGSGITDAVNGTFDPASANIGNNSITYEVSVGGCTSSDNINIEVFETPDASINEVGMVCISDAAFNLTAASSGGIWAGTGITDNNNGTFNPSVAGTGTHIITYQINNGSCSASDQISIEVVENPDASIIPAGPFCHNDSPINLSAVTPGGTWTGIGIIDTNSGLFDPSQAQVGENIITYTVSIGSCSASGQFTVQVIDGGNASITPVGPFCDGDFTVQLEAVNYGGLWSGSYVDDLGVFDVATAIPGTYSIVYTLDGLCGDSDTTSITIFPSNFVVDYQFQKPTCFGGDNAWVEFTVLGGTPPYTWSWGNFTSDTSYITGLGAGHYQFTITDINGCETNIETISIYDGSRDCLRIPNAFTPNDDGVNDSWVIENLIYYPDAVVQIFNRWGQKLYEGGAFDDPWDGTYNGNPVPTGNYIYVLVPYNDLQDEVGIVTLVR